MHSRDRAVEVIMLRDVRRVPGIFWSAMRAGRWLCPVLLCLGLVLPSTAAAGEIRLAWDPNPEPFVVGYILYVGTQPGVYSREIDVGNVTSYAFANPRPGQRYYFALAAYASDDTGPRCDEVSGFSSAPIGRARLRDGISSPLPDPPGEAATRAIRRGQPGSIETGTVAVPRQSAGTPGTAVLAASDGATVQALRTPVSSPTAPAVTPDATPLGDRATPANDPVLAAAPPAVVVRIQTPAHQAALAGSDEVVFTATARDPAGADITDRAVWSSSRDGHLGTGARVRQTLTPGVHVVTAAIDHGGTRHRARIVVIVDFP